MESRFGVDLGKVRVHDDAASHRRAEALAARAFSAGPDIAFARGAYDPGSRTGERLIAHEVAHTLQPAGTGPLVRRQQKGPAPGGTTSSVVELKGHGRFDPPAAIAERIKANGLTPTWVSVRFGTIASGEIPVYWGPRSLMSLSLAEGYQTPDPKTYMPAWGITLHHPAFRTHPQAHPTLWVDIQDSVVGGGMGWVTPVGLAMHVDRFKQVVPLHLLFGGLQDFSDLKLHGEIVNSLWNGHFRYLVPSITFLSDAFEGTGSLAVRDAGYDLDAALAVPVPGLPSASTVPVRTDEKSTGDSIFVRRRWSFSRSLGPGKGRLTGSLSATLGRGTLDIRGTGRYASTKPAVTGEVTLVVATMPIAEEAVRDKLGADAPPPDPALASDTIGITGWGSLDFALSKWITGRAEVIVHPDGNVTASGVLAPPVMVPLTDFYEKEKPIPGVKGSKAVPVGGLPPLADVSVVVDWAAFVKGSFGPGTLHDIRLEGLVSTHPLIVNRFELAAAVGAPATAGLVLVLGGRLAGRVLTGEAISAGLRGRGELELLMYAQAAAQVGRRPAPGAPAGAPLAEYFIKGQLQASANLMLRLAVSMTGSLIFWDGEAKLADREWSLGSSGVTLGFDYVLGGKGKDSSLTTSFDKIDFDADRFGRAIAERDLARAKHAKGPTSTSSIATPEPQAGAPDVPTLPTGATPPSTTGGVEGTVVRRLEEPFVMLTEHHTLRLELTEHPDLLMQSPRPRSILGKIKRARTALRKARPAGLEVRLADLDKIEQQATQVIEAAEKVAKNPPYLTPSVPGFRELAELIEDYAARYDVTDIEDSLGDVSVDPAQPETVLNKFPDLAAQQLIVAQVARILQAGVTAVQLRKIVDHHWKTKAGEDQAFELLELIDTMMMHGVQGWEKVITDLAIGGNKLKGARFALECIERANGWKDVAFEAEDPDAPNPGGRRWDAWMQGKLYEFKAWYMWIPVADRTFLKQMLQDYERTGAGTEMPLRWVFGPGPMSKDDIVGHMRAALDKVKDQFLKNQQLVVPGWDDGKADFVAARLTGIVVKVN